MQGVLNSRPQEGWQAVLEEGREEEGMASNYSFSISPLKGVYTVINLTAGGGAGAAGGGAVGGF